MDACLLPVGNGSGIRMTGVGLGQDHSLVGRISHFKGFTPLSTMYTVLDTAPPSVLKRPVDWQAIKVPALSGESSLFPWESYYTLEFRDVANVAHPATVEATIRARRRPPVVTFVYTVLAPLSLAPQRRRNGLSRYFG
jgi:hypothetical protein